MKGQKNNRNRSQSEVIGVILIFAVVLLGVLVIFAFGSSALDKQKVENQVERTQNEFGLLDSRASASALGEEGLKQTTVNVENGKIAVLPDSGWISMEVEYKNGSRSKLLDQEPLGEVRYSLKEHTVAYQAGAIWRTKKGQDPIMQSPPDFYFRGNTLSFPIIQMEREGSAGAGGDQQRLTTKGNEPVKVYPTDKKSNPIKGEYFIITIQSKYYKGWNQYLKENVGEDKVSVDINEKSVTVRLEIKKDDIQVRDAFGSAITATNNVELRGNSGTDSYNSTSSGNSNGDVVAGGTITKTGAAKVEGDELENQNLNYPSADSLIDSKVVEAQSSNDNSGVSCISGNKVSSACTGSNKLTSGTYYLTDGFINHDMEFDTSGGEINLVIDDDFEMNGNEVLQLVNGENKVNFYITGNMDMSGGAEIRSIDKDASRIRIYLKSGNKITFGRGGARVEGVIYAIGCEVEYRGNAEIYGSIIADDLFGRGTMSIHYDERLGNNRDVILPSVGDVRFIHSTKNTIGVEIK